MLTPSTVHPEVAELCNLVRASAMHVGIALNPETPVELVVPYVEAGLVDMVRRGAEEVGRRGHIGRTCD